jgi:phage shock protein C
MRDNTPGKMIADIRRRKGYSQDGLAYLCKIDVRTVQRIENNRVRPRPGTLKLLSDILESDLACLAKQKSTATWTGGLKAWRSATAFLTRRKGETRMKKQNVIQRLARSRNDKKIAGVCGGLGEHTSIPSWFWRLVFIGAVFAGGSGVIAYVLLWAFMPEAAGKDGLQAKTGAADPKARKKNENWLQRFNRSAGDRKIAGVCGGLGESTPLPSWCWRMAFVTAVVLHGFGIILYLLAWIFVPGKKAETKGKTVVLANG